MDAMEVVPMTMKSGEKHARKPRLGKAEVLAVALSGTAWLYRLCFTLHATVNFLASYTLLIVWRHDTYIHAFYLNNSSSRGGTLQIWARGIE